MKTVTLWGARLSKIGLFGTIGIVIAQDMLMKALGVNVDENGLVTASIPFVIFFATLAAVGDIVYRISARANTRT